MRLSSDKWVYHRQVILSAFRRENSIHSIASLKLSEMVATVWLHIIWFQQLVPIAYPNMHTNANTHKLAYQRTLQNAYYDKANWQYLIVVVFC